MDTDLGKTQINSLSQGITNAKTANKIDKIEKEIKAVELEIADRTKEININTIGAQGNIAIGNAKSALTQGNVDEETYKTKIASIRQEYTNLVLEAGERQSNINLTNAQVEQVKALTKNYQDQIELGKTGQKIQEDYYNNLIDLGYSKVVADGITNVIGFTTKGQLPVTETTTQTSTNSEGKWRTSTTKKTRQ